MATFRSARAPTSWALWSSVPMVAPRNATSAGMAPAFPIRVLALALLLAKTRISSAAWHWRCRDPSVRSAISRSKCCNHCSSLSSFNSPRRSTSPHECVIPASQISLQFLIHPAPAPESRSWPEGSDALAPTFPSASLWASPAGMWSSVATIASFSCSPLPALTCSEVDRSSHLHEVTGEGGGEGGSGTPIPWASHQLAIRPLTQ